MLAGHRLGAVHGEGDLVGVKVGDEVHHGGEGQRQYHPILPAKVLAKEHQQQRQRGQEERSLECVSHNSFGSTYFIGCCATHRDADRSDLGKLC